MSIREVRAPFERCYVSGVAKTRFPDWSNELPETAIADEEPSHNWSDKQCPNKGDSSPTSGCAVICSQSPRSPIRWVRIHLTTSRYDHGRCRRNTVPRLRSAQEEQ
jgi:hypothetical protein